MGSFNKEMKGIALLLIGITVSCLLGIVSIVLLFFAFGDLLTVVSVFTGIFVAVFLCLLPIYLKKCKDLKKLVLDINNKLKKYDNIAPKVESIDSTPDAVKSLLGWWYQRSRIVRTGQTFDFTMEDCRFEKDGKEAIKITGVHKYTIENQSKNDMLKIPIDLVDELGLQSAEDGYGFTKVFYTIEGELKKEYPLKMTHTIKGVVTELKFLIDVPAGKSAMFEFNCLGIFRCNDRYIWYSQDFCNDCLITITNNTKSVIKRYQINHHDEELIMPKIQYKSQPNVIKFDSPIYPHEGFTMYWEEVYNENK